MATNRNIATTVIAEISHLGEETEGLYIPDIVKMIPDAIRDIVMEVGQVGLPDERKLFTKEFSIPITPIGGDLDYNEVDLISSVNAADAMLIHLPFPRVFHGLKSDDSFQELLYVADKANLDFFNLSDGFAGYAVDDRTLYLKSDPELTGDLKIRSFYVPQVLSLPRQFEGKLVWKIIEKLGITRG